MEFFLAVLVPVGVVLACGFLRTAVRRSYRHNDYCLGMDLTLAGLAAVVAYALELTKRFRAKHINGDEYSESILFILVFILGGLFLLLLLLLLHQKLEDKLTVTQQSTGASDEREEGNPGILSRSFWTHPAIWLVGVANLAGIGYMASFLQIVRTMP